MARDEDDDVQWGPQVSAPPFQGTGQRPQLPPKKKRKPKQDAKAVRSTASILADVYRKGPEDEA